MIADHRDFSSNPQHHRDTQREGEHGGHHGAHHNPEFNRRELYSALPESSPYHHVRGAHDDHQVLHFTSPYENTSARSAAGMEQSRSRDAHHDRELATTENNVERHLRQNEHDFAPVYRELDHLRSRDGANIQNDLDHINSTMHDRGLMRGQELIRDDRTNGHGWGVVAEDKQAKEHDGHRDGTMVSTSHAPHESAELRRHYSSGHHGRGHHRGHHYNGWQQSVEGGGGAHGGYDSHAAGDHVPTGERRNLIEQALRLAGVPVTESSINAVNTIVSRESSWDPNRSCTWDSNARAGHPSTGLMQTIPSTFRQYALPGMNDNIHDPLSNLVAGIRYAEARYGGHGTSGVERVASRPGGY